MHPICRTWKWVKHNVVWLAFVALFLNLVSIPVIGVIYFHEHGDRSTQTAYQRCLADYIAAVEIVQKPRAVASTDLQTKLEAFVREPDAASRHAYLAAASHYVEVAKANPVPDLPWCLLDPEAGS